MNYYRFDPTVRYELKVDNDGDAEEDVTYRFRFSTTVGNGNTFLYNTNQVTSPDDPDRQADLHRHTRDVRWLGGARLDLVSVCRRQTSGRARIRRTPRSRASSDRKVFAGPRDDPFFVDLGSIFDLGGLRPFNEAHVIPLMEGGEDGVATTTCSRSPSRCRRRICSRLRWRTERSASTPAPSARRLACGNGNRPTSGDWIQVSRLGNPLINEVVIPLGQS